MYCFQSSKVRIWDESTFAGKFPTWNKRVARGFDFMPPSKTISAIKNDGKNDEIGNKNHKKTTDDALLSPGVNPLEGSPM